MPRVEERNRNNVRAGVFVTLSIALGLAVMIVLTDALASFEPVKKYIVSFSVASGVADLAKGSEVRVGGVAMGKVVAVQPQTDQQPFTTIHVRIAVDPHVTLYDNAKVVLTRALLGAESWLDIPTVGDPASGKPLPEDAIIAAIESPGMLSTLLGPSNADKAAMIIDDAQQLSSFLGTLGEEYDRRVVPIVSDIHDTIKNAKGLTGRIEQEDYPRWAQSVDRIFGNVNAAAEKLDVAMTSGRDVAASVKDAVDVNRPKVESILGSIDDASANVKAVTETARQTNMPQITKLLERGNEGIDAFARVGEQAQSALTAELPGLSDALASSRLAAQQLKLAMIEVRRSPWKILYRPSTEELQHELLYETARTFALAASDLKAASASMDRLMTQHSAELDGDAETLERFRQNLLDSFENYQKAQQRLLDVLMADQPGR